MREHDKAREKLSLSTDDCWLGREIALDYLLIFSSDEVRVSEELNYNRRNFWLCPVVLCYLKKRCKITDT